MAEEITKSQLFKMPYVQIYYIKSKNQTASHVKNTIIKIKTLINVNKTRPYIH